MKQRYHHYTLWEDWSATMYRREPPTSTGIVDAGRVLANSSGFGDAAAITVQAWPLSTEHNLTDRSQNRKAWLGQATATRITGASQKETCIAWNTQLTDHQRHAANRAAEAVIQSWAANAAQQEFTYA